MTAQGSNRYALFIAEDENASPTSSPPINAARNPFVNQIADDSIPWQQVKKRGASAVQPQRARLTLGIKDRAKAALNRPLDSQSRTRAISSSTAESADTAVDPHENWCGVCSLKFGSKVALLSHIRQTADHQHYCNLCKRVFKDRNGLKNHVENSWGHDIFCNLCLSAFKDEWGLKNHFENNYQVGHEFVCLTCLLGFRSKVELNRHLQTAPMHSWCGTCKRRFRNQDERDEHWQKTTRHKHCLQPGCDFDGPDETALTLHLKRDHFQCAGCKLILPSQNKLNIHYETCSFALHCPQCNEACVGRNHLAMHLENCYVCDECSFWTNHEGNYQIHMTKHSINNIPCWACATPMRTYSSLINHLESGRCTSLPHPSFLTLCLGKWWYSPLYMDLDIHAQIRTGRIMLDQAQQWMNDGMIHPFICRAESCEKTFGRMSSLVLHCESLACGWDVDRLNMLGLEKEFKQLCVRRDSAIE